MSLRGHEHVVVIRATATSFLVHEGSCAPGHEVVALSRGEREPYTPAPEWRAVNRIAMADRERARTPAGTFGERIAALDAAPTP